MCVDNFGRARYCDVLLPLYFVNSNLSFIELLLQSQLLTATGIPLTGGFLLSQNMRIRSHNRQSELFCCFVVVYVAIVGSV